MRSTWLGVRQRRFLRTKRKAVRLAVGFITGNGWKRRVSGPIARSPAMEPRFLSATSIAIIIRGATFAPKSIFKTERSRVGELCRGRRTDAQGEAHACRCRGSVRDAKELEVVRDVCAPGEGIR